MECSSSILLEFFESWASEIISPWTVALVCDTHLFSFMDRRSILLVEKEVGDVGQNSLTFLEKYVPLYPQWYMTSHT